MGMSLSALEPREGERECISMNWARWHWFTSTLYKLGCDMRGVSFHNDGEVVTGRTARAWATTLNALKDEDFPRDPQATRFGPIRAAELLALPVFREDLPPLRALVRWCDRVGGFEQW